MNNNYLKAPYEIIEFKLALAEKTLELAMVTREKWARLETMKDILKREEDLIKEISGASDQLQKIEDRINDKTS